jgi:hypothetical protein
MAKAKPLDAGRSTVAGARGVARLDTEDSTSGDRTLGEALSRLVADPVRVEALHEVLGPFCHRSRNILNSLKISIYLARRKETSPGGSDDVWAEVEQRYLAVEEFFDRLQMLWHPLAQALVRLSLSLLLEDRRSRWVAQFGVHDRVLQLSAIGKDDVGDYDPNSLGVGLDAFVAWRASVGDADRDARLRWGTRDRRFELEWEELPAPLRARGRTRAKAAVSAGRPGSLALPLLGRVIAAHGGVMELVEPSGRHVKFSWPQFAR